MRNFLPIVFLSALFFLFPKTAMAVAVRSLPTPTPTQALNTRTTNIGIVTPVPTSTPTPVSTSTQRRISLTGTPALVKLDTGITVESPDFDTSKIGQERWLNPQPEPPIFDSVQVRKTEENTELTWPSFGFSELIKSKVEFKPEGALMTIPLQLTGGGPTINLLIKPEFKIINNQTVLMDNGQEIVLNSLPTVIYQKIKAILTEFKITAEDDFMLTTENGTVLYSLTIKEPVKLFGFIPLTMKTKLLVNDNDGKAKVIDKPWYSFVVKEAVDISKKFNPLPNLVVEDIKFEPAQFNKDTKDLKAVATVKNEGMGNALLVSDSVHLKGTILGWELYGKLYKINYTFIELLSGESKDFTITMNQVPCGQTLSFKILNQGFFKETSEEDNSKSTVLECQ